jgi:TPR repeat protein
VKKDPAKAFDCFTKAAAQGHARGQNGVGLCYNTGQGVEKDLAKAIEWFTKAALQGDERAQRNLGLCYRTGDGVEKDLAKAFEWFKKAAAQGCASAQHNVGLCYLTETGVTKDHAKAVEWLTKAAVQGNALAQMRLGLCYKKDQGVEYDLAKAVEWYTKAAVQGSAAAQRNLGMCYKNGEGVEKDHAKAVEWFTKAAVQGNAAGQNSLAICYKLGEGVEKDRAKAIEWYTKAAAQGNKNAQGNLGNCYELGEGVEVDYAKAVEWHTKAAVQGNENAQDRLAICYEFGMGVEKDHVKAIEWFTKSYSFLADLTPDEAKKTIEEMIIPDANKWLHSRAREDDKHDDDEMEGARRDAEQQLQDIVRADLWREMQQLHQELMETRLKAAMAPSSDSNMRNNYEHRISELFLVLKEKAGRESERLAQVTGVCRKKYEGLRQRWVLVTGIKAMASVSTQPACPPSLAAAQTSSARFNKSNEVEYIDLLLERSSWAHSAFETLMFQLGQKFNAARHPLDLGLDPSVFRFQLDPTSHPISGHAGLNTFVRCGPLKTRQRCVDKTREYCEDPIEAPEHPQRPAARYLLDVLRATFAFEDPYKLAAFFAMLKENPLLQIVRVKNKLCDTTLDMESRTTVLINVQSRTTVLINVQFEDPFGYPMVGEVQLILHAFLVIKKTLHKFYRFVRALEHKAVLTSPIFHSEASAPKLEPVVVVKPLEDTTSLAGLEMQHQRASKFYTTLGDEHTDVSFECALERLSERIVKIKAK